MIITGVESTITIVPGKEIVDVRDEVVPRPPGAGARRGGSGGP